METKEISGNWHKEKQILTSNDPACYGENLGVSIEGKFIVLDTFGAGWTAEHNSLYEKYEKIAELIAHAPEMYALLERLWQLGEAAKTFPMLSLEKKLLDIIEEARRILAKARGEGSGND